MTDALTASGVTRRYAGHAVLSEVCLTLPPGQITALLGGSGAGKSTLLRLLAGLEPVDAGEIRLGHQVLSASGLLIPAEKRRTGLIFQDFALFPHLTALRNIMFGLKHLPAETARAEAASWLDRFGLTARAQAYPHELSGGEQQRVAIARALANDPTLLLADEPTGNLDPETGHRVFELLMQAARQYGLSALIATHNLDMAAHMDRRVTLQDGAIVEL